MPDKNKDKKKKVADAAVAGATIAVGLPGVASTVGVLAANAAGFSAAGPVAGSFAAAWMSSTGSVAAGELYVLHNNSPRRVSLDGKTPLGC
jgi:hypothetical protein